MAHVIIFPGQIAKRSAVGLVLYLEDTSDQQDLVAMVLNTIGVEVEVAGDGQEGLKKIASRGRI
jgi:CheY-like chemotaxis protein